ncbi:polyketide synthase dehydratase domain-containing protein, partial [Burkholderia pseudomallei]
RMPTQPHGPTSDGRAESRHPLRRDAADGRFLLDLDGDEAFLADHRVDGRRVLPGVAHLEIAYEAARRTFGPADAIRIRNLGWIRPIVADGALRIGVELSTSGAAEGAFRLYTTDPQHGRLTHSEGAIGRADVAQSARALDLGALRDAFATAERVDPAVWYDGFSRAGIDYGPSHRCLETCAVGPAGVLARVRLPAAEARAARPFTLHPGL